MSGTCRVPTRKVRDYLLDPDHKVGGPKSTFFRSLGFERARHGELANALVDHYAAATLENVVTTEHGRKLVLVGPIHAPDGRTARIKSVWIVASDDAIPSFVTAMPR